MSAKNPSSAGTFVPASVVGGVALPPENHQAEQYFFDAATRSYLAGLCASHERVACLCCPSLGVDLRASGHDGAVILDRDERFAGPGFENFNLGRPTPPAQPFDLVVCDPPFFTLSLSTLFAGVRAVASFDFATPLVVSYVERREESLLGTFAPFHLQRTGVQVTYQTVQDQDGRNRINLYSNFELVRR